MSSVSPVFCAFPAKKHSCLIKRRPTAAHCAQSRALPHTLSRRSLVRRRMHPPTGNRQFRAQLFQAGKSDKITFSKIKFFTLKNRENTCFLINYGISVANKSKLQIEIHLAGAILH